MSEQQTAQYDLNEKFYIFDSFLSSNNKILEKGNDEWDSSKIFFQLSIEHADNSPFTQAAEKYEEYGKVDFDYMRDVNRNKEIYISPLVQSFEFDDDINGYKVFNDSLFLWIAKTLYIKNGSSFNAIFTAHLPIKNLYFNEGIAYISDEKNIYIFNCNSNKIVESFNFENKIISISIYKDDIYFLLDKKIVKIDKVTNSLIDIFENENDLIGMFIIDNNVLVWDFDNIILLNGKNKIKLFEFTCHRWMIGSQREVVKINEKNILIMYSRFYDGVEIWISKDYLCTLEGNELKEIDSTGISKLNTGVCKKNIILRGKVIRHIHDNKIIEVTELSKEYHNLIEVDDYYILTNAGDIDVYTKNFEFLGAIEVKADSIEKYENLLVGLNSSVLVLFNSSVKTEISRFNIIDYVSDPKHNRLYFIDRDNKIIVYENQILIKVLNYHKNGFAKLLVLPNGDFVTYTFELRKVHSSIVLDEKDIGLVLWDKTTLLLKKHLIFEESKTIQVEEVFLSNNFMVAKLVGGPTTEKYAVNFDCTRFGKFREHNFQKYINSQSYEDIIHKNLLFNTQLKWYSEYQKVDLINNFNNFFIIKEEQERQIDHFIYTYTNYRNLIFKNHNNNFSSLITKKKINNLSEQYFSDNLQLLLSASGIRGGLRTQFIKLFIDRFLYLPKPLKLSNSKSIREYQIQDNNSVKKIDLLLLDLDDDIIIGVENKFLSEDSNRQLDTYYKLLNEQFITVDSICLIYLTLDGREPRYSNNLNIINLSWLDDVYPMIKEAQSVIKTKNKKIDSLLNTLDAISTIRSFPKGLNHPFELDKFSTELYGSLNQQEWKFDKTKREFRRNNTKARKSKNKFNVCFNPSNSACLLKSKNIQVYLPFDLKGEQINYLIKSFLTKLKTKPTKKINLQHYFNIPFHEYQIYRYFNDKSNREMSPHLQHK